MPTRPDTTKERPTVWDSYTDAGGRLYGFGAAAGVAAPGTWSWSPTGRDGGRLEVLRGGPAPGSDAQYTVGTGTGSSSSAPVLTGGSSGAAPAAAPTDVWSTLATYAAAGAAIAAAAALAASLLGGR